MKKTILQHIVLLAFIVLGFIQCNNSTHKMMTKAEKVKFTKEFINDISDHFKDYKEWRIEKDEGRSYYLVIFGTNHEKFLLFNKSDTLFVRFVLDKKTSQEQRLSSIYPLQNCTQEFIRNIGYSFNINDLKNNVEFMTKNNIDKISYYSTPDRIYFQKQDLVILYLFSSNLNLDLSSFEQINNQWYCR